MREVRAKGTSTDSHQCSTAGMPTLCNLTGLQELGEVVTTHIGVKSVRRSSIVNIITGTVLPTLVGFIVLEKRKGNSKGGRLADGESPALPLNKTRVNNELSLHQCGSVPQLSRLVKLVTIQ